MPEPGGDGATEVVVAEIECGEFRVGTWMVEGERVAYRMSRIWFGSGKTCCGQANDTVKMTRSLGWL